MFKFSVVKLSKKKIGETKWHKNYDLSIMSQSAWIWLLSYVINLQVI